MYNAKGSNNKEVKQYNRVLILRQIAVHPQISRAELAETVGLSKMAVGNIVTELMECGFVEEARLPADATSYGRPPSVLRIAKRSPLICGMLIKRGVFQVVLSDLSAKTVEKREIRYHTLRDSGEIVQRLMDVFNELKERQRRQIVAVGISAIGPVDEKRGKILKPPFFYGITDVPIVDEIRERTGLPTYLINDASAGALAEKLYGGAQEEANFAYLHIMNGVGLGCVLDNRLYSGNTGQSGEIGHTSINFMGPRCECGNVGCLELYANVQNMIARIREMEDVLNKPLALETGGELGWKAIVDNANRGNPCAAVALEEFLGYVACALINLMNILDCSCVVVGYDAGTKGDIVERMLRARLDAWTGSTGRPAISIRHSAFHGDAPLIGAIACCAERVFDMSLPVIF